jgi:protein-L-isoaspartate(D-aspartate) O-methyltransferase
MARDTADVRREYAEAIRTESGIRSEALLAAFARVPRERFVGKGPWYFASKESWLAGGARYLLSESADPRLVYRNLAIAFDPTSDLTNGHPGKVAAWIEALALRPRSRVLHVGCGTGYYTAIMAAAAGPGAQIVAVEIDPSLARRAKRCLAGVPGIDLRCADAKTIDPGPVDAILVSAGFLGPASTWLDRLQPGGRMMMPITFSLPGVSLTKGPVFCIGKDADSSLSAAYHSFAMIYGDPAGRDAALDTALHDRCLAATWGEVRSVRRDAHEPEDACWLHAPGCCFSTREAGGRQLLAPS